MSAMSNQTTKSQAGNNNIMSVIVKNENDENNKGQLKRDSRHTLADDETDWIAEIPFWNVSINFSQLKKCILIYFTVYYLLQLLRNTFYTF